MSVPTKQIQRRCRVCGVIFYTSKTSKITCSKSCREFYRKNQKNHSLGHVKPIWVKQMMKPMINQNQNDYEKQKVSKHKWDFMDKITQKDIKALREGGRCPINKCACGIKINPPFKLCYKCWIKSIAWKQKPIELLEHNQ